MYGVEKSLKIYCQDFFALCALWFVRYLCIVKVLILHFWHFVLKIAFIYELKLCMKGRIKSVIAIVIEMIFLVFCWM